MSMGSRSSSERSLTRSVSGVFLWAAVVAALPLVLLALPAAAGAPPACVDATDTFPNTTPAPIPDDPLPGL